MPTVLRQTVDLLLIFVAKHIHKEMFQCWMSLDPDGICRPLAPALYSSHCSKIDAGVELKTAAHIVSSPMGRFKRDGIEKVTSCSSDA